MYETEGGLRLADFEEKRMAGDYEIFQVISIGTKEIVMGESPNAAQDERYMCAYCTTNDIFAQYSGVMVSDDYTEILELFQERVRDETQKLREELSQPEREGIDDRPVTNMGFVPIESDDDLNGKRAITLCHYPLLSWKHAKRSYMIHGHIHRKTDMDYWPLLCNRDRVLNAGVDINGFSPVTFEELLENNQRWKASHLPE